MPGGVLNVECSVECGGARWGVGWRMWGGEGGVESVEVGGGNRMDNENVEWRMWSAREMEDPERGDAQRSGVHMWRCSVEVVLGRGVLKGGVEC